MKVLLMIIMFGSALFARDLIAQEYPAISYLKKISEKADSVTISTVYSQTKEESSPFEDLVDTTYTIKTARLTDCEIKAFNSKLSHFKNTIVLTNHFDIEIRFYIKDSIFSKAIISSQTRNISILNHLDCEEKEDILETYHNTVCIFRGTISKNLEKHLATLLRKKKLWTKSTTFFEW